MNGEDRLRLRQQVAAWNDTRGRELALSLADRYRDLLPRRITHSQLSGLNGVVQAAQSIEIVKAFAKHQRQRAESAGRRDVKDYWDALIHELSLIEEEASTLFTRDEESPRKVITQHAPPWLTMWLVRKFVQHLVVHSLYLGKVSSN